MESSPIALKNVKGDILWNTPNIFCSCNNIAPFGTNGWGASSARGGWTSRTGSIGWSSGAHLLTPGARDCCISPRVISCWVMVVCKVEVITGVTGGCGNHVLFGWGGIEHPGSHLHALELYLYLVRALHLYIYSWLIHGPTWALSIDPSRSPRQLCMSHPCERIDISWNQ